MFQLIETSYVLHWPVMLHMYNTLYTFRHDYVRMHTLKYTVLSDYVTMEPASNLASLQLNDSAAKWKRDLETYLIDSTQVDLDENLGEG